MSESNSAPKLSSAAFSTAVMVYLAVAVLGVLVVDDSMVAVVVGGVGW